MNDFPGMGLKTIFNLFLRLVALLHVSQIGCADALNISIHSWPVVERVQNVMHFCVTLMMNLRMCGRYEFHLFVSRSYTIS
jgi:hypothetical protein